MPSWLRLLGITTVLGLLASACSPAEVVSTSTTLDASTTTEAPSTTTTTEAVTTTTTGETTTTRAPDADVGDLLVVGDWGSGTVPQGSVAGAMLRYAEENEVAAILTTGDNFYSDDHEFLMHPFGWAAEMGIPFWITWGNHDVETETRVAAVEEVFDDPPRWTVHQWGDIDVVILDSTQVTSLQQAAFFLDAMSSSSQPTIVVLHHPPYSCTHEGPTVEVVNRWVEVLDEDVFLVLAGHDHSYQRFLHDRVTYVVTGGGGAVLREITECPVGHPELQAGDAIHHFLALRRDGDSVLVEAIDVGGGVFDQSRLGLP